MTHRSLAEIVTEDLRVLVIDEPTKTSMAAQGNFGRTVTLQVTPEEAQKLNVAAEPDKSSLILRPTGTVPAVVTDEDLLTGGVGRRRVARLGEIKPPQNVVADPGSRVMRGDKAVQVKLR
jgi:Flp pilus assembly protein CpaB